MTFLINCSNIKSGGGLQVSNSICSQLNRFSQHKFCVVLSNSLNKTKEVILEYENVEVFTYDIRNNISTILLGRDPFLDSLVKEKRVNAVLTVFGPSRWIPKCKHICGFARAQLLLIDSPYFKELSWKELLKNKVLTWAFKRSSRFFYTENPYISEKLQHLLGNVKVYTVTNYYNQVYDHPDMWKKSIDLPAFSGTTILTITSNGVWKNMKITAEIARYLKNHYPSFRFRFVTTLTSEEAWFVDGDISEHFCLLGRVDVSECPNLYKQADVMFMPSLLECFTATYPEAMRMEIPIVTTDLEFAHSLCNGSACYYDAINAEAAAEAIYRVATDKNFASQLVKAGKKQLITFDNYKQRAEKLIGILENIS
ncbi:MAG: glycosyltransferase [Prevotella sp.]|nr:glycosyltransferase [Prevotella sp.]